MPKIVLLSVLRVAKCVSIDTTPSPTENPPSGVSTSVEPCVNKGVF